MGSDFGLVFVEWYKGKLALVRAEGHRVNIFSVSPTIEARVSSWARRNGYTLSESAREKLADAYSVFHAVREGIRSREEIDL